MFSNFEFQLNVFSAKNIFQYVYGILKWARGPRSGRNDFINIFQQQSYSPFTPFCTAALRFPRIHQYFFHILKSSTETNMCHAKI